MPQIISKIISVLKFRKRSSNYSQITLTALKNGERFAEITAKSNESTNIGVGRSRETNETGDRNLIVLSWDQRISRFHCKIISDDDQWKIRDIRSKAVLEKSKIGTFVGETDIRDIDVTVLKDGDVIRIGGYEIRVSILKIMPEGIASAKISLLAPKHPRVKTPTLIQMEAVECGAASLGIILGYYGKFVPLEQLRIDCGVSRDGSNAFRVVRAAKNYGLVAKAFRYEVKNLYEEVKFPAILHWNLNHFLVLEGFEKGKVCLNDPARGPRKVSPEDLDISFSGVTLTFEPRLESEKPDEEPVFKKGGKQPNKYAALRSRLAGAQMALAYVILCGLLLVIPGLIVPTFSRIFIDEYLVAKNESLIKPLLIGMCLTAILRMIVTGLREHYLLRFETKLALSNSCRFFEHILRLPVSFFTQRYAGEIGSRVMLNNNVAKLLTGKLTTNTVDAYLVAFYAALMFMYDGILTLICVILALINILIVIFASRKRTDASQKLLQEQGKLMGTAMNGLRMIETLKATGSEGEFFERWAGYQAKTLKEEQGLSLLQSLTTAVSPFINTIITTTILVIGSQRVMEGSITIGMLVAFQHLMENFTKPLSNLASFGAELQELEGDMNRLDDVLRYPQDTKYSNSTPPADSVANKTKLEGRVELRDITFGFSPFNAPMIENFNLTVEPGRRIAIVGRSGSGKTTIARLISCLYKPWEGRILFDDIDVDRIPRSLLYNSLGVVDQDIFLFGGTIRENLSMWDSSVPDANIVTAARDAAIDEVIQSRLYGYHSIVEEGGGNFSGGQRQCLEIARSLVYKPSVLILDEATSALDPVSEKEIIEHLIPRGCSCIIIAHRLSTIRDCDEIIVLDKGRIIERGTHVDLIDKKGLYSKLLEENA